MLARLEAEERISREQGWKTKHILLTDEGRELLERAFPSQLEQQPPSSMTPDRLR